MLSKSLVCNQKELLEPTPRIRNSGGNYSENRKSAFILVVIIIIFFVVYIWLRVKVSVLLRQVLLLQQENLLFKVSIRFFMLYFFFFQNENDTLATSFRLKMEIHARNKKEKLKLSNVFFFHLPVPSRHAGIPWSSNRVDLDSQNPRRMINIATVLIFFFGFLCCQFFCVSWFN